MPPRLLLLRHPTCNGTEALQIYAGEQVPISRTRCIIVHINCIWPLVKRILLNIILHHML